MQILHRDTVFFQRNEEKRTSTTLCRVCPTYMHICCHSSLSFLAAQTYFRKKSTLNQKISIEKLDALDKETKGTDLGLYIVIGILFQLAL